VIAKGLLEFETPAPTIQSLLRGEPIRTGDVDSAPPRPRASVPSSGRRRARARRNPVGWSPSRNPALIAGDDNNAKAPPLGGVCLAARLC
jgi:hypothetical protein